MISWYNRVFQNPTGKQVQYITMRNRNQVVIPLDLGIRIDEDAPVRKLIEICDELD